MATVQHNTMTGADLHEAGPVTVDLDLTDQASDPATPASGHHAAYAKAGGLYVKDPSGAVVGPLIGLNGQPLGLTGATAATRYVGGTTSGAPVSGTFAKGDFNIGQDGSVWICTAAGSPGTWTRVSGGGGSTPTIIDTATAAASGSASSLNVTLPATVQADDFIILFASHAAAVTGATGYVAITSDAGPYIGGAALFKLAVAGDASAVVTVNFSGSDIAGEVIAVIVRGAARLQGIAFVRNGPGSGLTVVTTPGTLQAATSDLFLGYCGARGAAATITASIGSTVVGRTADTNGASVLVSGSLPPTVTVAFTSSAAQAGMYAAVVTIS